jgi:preprotein translocase subunit SecD
MRVLLPLCLLLVACPERQAPERGLMLVYRKPSSDSIRSVVDRRLAQLKLRANLSEDDSTITVRVAEGTDVSRIKALFAQTAHLEFCGEDAVVAERWCDEPWPPGITTDSAKRACSLLGPTRELLEAAILADAAGDAGGDAGPEDAGLEDARRAAAGATPTRGSLSKREFPKRAFAFGTSDSRASAFAITGCFTPRVVAAEVREAGDQPAALSLEFDRASGRDFAALTTSLVGKRLIILLDGVVNSAPVVMEPITGGKGMLTTGPHDRAALEVMAASLVGGTLPVLLLERESTWGPPPFKR